MRLFHIQIYRLVNAQGKFNSTNAYTRKKNEKPQINNLNSKLKGRIMKTNPKREQEEELLKIRTKINKFEAEKNW